MAYSQLRQFPQAERAYLAALEADGNDLASLNNLAYLYANDLNQADKALPYVTRAARLAPDSGDVLDTLGWTLAKTGSYAEAERKLTRALQLITDPANAAQAHYHLGWVYEQTHRPSEAAKHYHQGIETLQGRQDDPVRKDLLEALNRVQKRPAAK